jgi:hypothetical protein
LYADIVAGGWLSAAVPAIANHSAARARAAARETACFGLYRLPWGTPRKKHLYRREAGDTRHETGDWGLEIGDTRLEAGGWRLEAGGWRLEAGGSILQPSLLNPLTRPLSCWLRKSPKPSINSALASIDLSVDPREQYIGYLCRIYIGYIYILCHSAYRSTASQPGLIAP